ncbi:Mobile element protein [Leifsonia rubra CMS 76R]|nr:Mobile element protein [Leifsonia rubra CMS 76R]
MAEFYGVGHETLRNWLIKYREANGGTETELTVPERARLKTLERENQELKAETQFLKKAAAYFAREQR